MTELTPFQFLIPGWLLLLPPVWWLIWLHSRRARRQSMWSRICDPQLLHKMITEPGNWDRNRWLTWTLTIILTLGILAAAGPSWRQQSYPVIESVSARVVALDLSQSMLVGDVGPSRFKHAVTAAREIIAADFDGETGLVVFAGAAFVVSPLSNDAKTLLAFLEALDPSTMPEDGTRIDLAIDTAQSLLEASISGSGQILIITAGDSNSQGAVQSALTAAQNGHRVSVLAIGTAEGAPMLKPGGGLLRDTQGKIIIKRTNFKLLQRIAQIGRGSIVSLTGASGNSDLLISRLSANQLLESDQVTDNSQREAANDGSWLVLLMLPFALVLFRKNLIWMLLLGAMVPGDRELYAQEWDSFWHHPEKMAFDAYQRGDYQDAYELSSNPVLQGSAYYQSGQYQQATELFGEVDSAQSIYNRGNALAQQGQFPEAIVAYQQALTVNPDLELARYNKRLIELYLEQLFEAENGQSSDPGDGDPSSDNPDQTDTETRIGIVGQGETNPGDDPELGPGLGASNQSGQVDPVERFDGLEQDPGRFDLRAQSGARLPDPEFIERWLNSLPESSTDLFRRKFLRDYQRQQQR